MRTRELHGERENRWTENYQNIMKNPTKIYQKSIKNQGTGAPKSRPGGTKIEARGLQNRGPGACWVS